MAIYAFQTAAVRPQFDFRFAGRTPQDFQKIGTDTHQISPREIDSIWRLERIAEYTSWADLLMETGALPLAAPILRTKRHFIGAQNDCQTARLFELTPSSGQTTYAFSGRNYILVCGEFVLCASPPGDAASAFIVKGLRAHQGLEQGPQPVRR